MTTIVGNVKRISFDGGKTYYLIKDDTARLQIGNLQGLVTEEKTDLVGAINEVVSDIPAVSSTYNPLGTDAVNGIAVAEAINVNIGKVFRPSGSIAFANLPALNSANVGNVYNITDSFTTTSDFVEGAGNVFPAGTNVGIVDVGSGDLHSYKYDVFAGTYDLSGYQTLLSSSNKLNADYIENGTTNKAVTFVEWNSKQDTLVSGNGIDIEGNVISAVPSIYTAGENININGDIISATDTTYTAGTNITIENNVISAVSTEYTAGEGIDITNGEISCTVDIPEYTAGTNISIENGVISATDTTYSAGEGIDITNNVISSTVEYTAGDNISIANNVISATDTTYSAGTNITIENNVISAIDTTYTAGEGIDITSGVISSTVEVPTYTAGTNVQISDQNVISATDTTYTAGTGISIENGVISNTQTSAEWGNITGTLSDQTDLQNALDAINARLESIFHYKGSVATENDLPTQDNQVGDVYNITSDGHNVAWNGTTWDKLSETIDLSPYMTTAEFESIIANYCTETVINSKDKAIKDEIYGRIWSNVNNPSAGWFKTRYNLASGSYSLMFNESDGGGSQVYDKTDDIISYVGVNLEEGHSAGNSAVNVQIYSKNKTNNLGSRLNVSSHGIYYTSNKANGSYTASDELVTKGALDAVSASIPSIDNLATKAEVQAVEESIPSIEGLVTEEELQDVADSIPSIDNLATKTELQTVANSIPSIEGLATEVELQEVADSIPSIDNLATKSELQTVANSIPSVDNLATKTELQEVENSIPSIDNLATKSELQAVEQEIPSIANLATKTELQNAVDTIDAKLESIFHYKGSVATDADLPAQNNQIGDVYNVASDGHNVAWNGTTWDKLSETIDLTPYMTIQAFNTEIANYCTGAELQAVADAIPSIDNLATKAELQAVEQEIPSVDNLATKTELQAVEQEIPSIDGLATSAELQAVADSIPSIQGLATETALNTEVQARQSGDSAIISKIWSSQNLNSGWFRTKYDANTGSYALLFNESDGGGVQVYDKTANVISFVGANLEEGQSAGSSAVDIQIYSKDKTSSVGSRLNVAPHGMYYTNGKTNGSYTASDEIATKGDLANIPSVTVDSEMSSSSENPVQNKVINSALDTLSTTLGNSVAEQKGDITAINLQLQELNARIESLKNLDYETVIIDSESPASYTDETKAFKLSGDISNNLAVTGECVSLSNATSDSSYLKFKATEDISIKGADIVGTVPRSTSNTIVSVYANDFVTIRDCNFAPTSAYNAIEVGLSDPLAKGVTIDNCNFYGDYSNNAINVFGMAENGVITISNCYFEHVSNLLRLSNRTNTHWTINLINCVCDQWESGSSYAGMVLCQDYNSHSAEEAQEANQFSKITINFQNCTKPDGTKIVMPESLSTICGSGDDNQILYVYNDYEGVLTYSANRYPTITIS